ncbi:alpha/beta fold hydrolase [Muricoccus radiodurans]|uniref:alpha/beta fold hydrolase n=1 Tax=Muricoccus radiodurans TaxID=2231721 RepID=UPI003CEAD110
MLDAAAIFDPDRSRRPPLRRLLHEARSLASRPLPPPSPAELPRGHGQPVLVIPAFLTNDAFVAGLRGYLAACGFRPFGWELGINWGPTERLLRGVERRLDTIRRDHGPVALIGYSMGGLLARHLAHERPADIRHVVTIASPFRLPTASTIEPLIRLFARRYSPRASPERIGRPLPVPSTAIFTRDDGIVAPDSCWMTEPGAEVVALRGAHVTLAAHPDALRATIRRLSDA